MPSLQWPSRRALGGASIALLNAAAVWVVATAGSARAVSIGQLEQQVSAGLGRVSDLSGTVSAQSSRLAQLNAGIAGLERQIAELQARIAPEVAKLIELRGELSRARSQLSQLERFEAQAETALSQQLVATYEADQPDFVTVVLEARGFQDLLDRISFEKRIQRQDARVVKSVRATRRAVAAQATRLGALEARQQAITNVVLNQRNELLHERIGLVSQQIAVERARSAAAKQLAAARSQVGGLRAQLSKIEETQAAAAAPASGLSGGVQVASGGGVTFPLPKDAASPPGSWSPDDGVDISAPGGTPELAVCSGTVVLHGIGGFGPWAPVLHCDNPIGGYSYVYYGHAGPANELPVGTRVSAGQVIGEVGPGIVGISSGPHLEIGFCDSSGSPIGPQSASQMMAVLQSAYGG
jgi:murein DD-endopeptidase MepM/ murein hydrolase activator NlpD